MRQKKLTIIILVITVLLCMINLAILPEQAVIGFANKNGERLLFYDDKNEIIIEALLGTMNGCVVWYILTICSGMMKTRNPGMNSYKVIHILAHVAGFLLAISGTVEFFIFLILYLIL